MINAMDDRDDPEHIVTQEAMSSLCRLLPHIPDTDLHSLLIHTAIRIRPFFDHVSAGPPNPLPRILITCGGQWGVFGR